MGCCSMRRASTLISIPLSCWTTNQDGGREMRAKGWPTAHIGQGQAFLLMFFFFFHSLPLLVCEDGQLVFVPDTWVSMFFNCGHRERRGRERERNKQFWMNVVATVSPCLIFLVKQAKVHMHHLLFVCKSNIFYGECRIKSLWSRMSLADYYCTNFTTSVYCNSTKIKTLAEFDLNN